MKLKPVHLCVVWGFLALPSLWWFQPAQSSTELNEFESGSVILENNRDQCLHVAVWFADLPAQQAQGLMFVRQLGEFEGMLFRYRAPRIITMWMKNTYISLDMIFISDDDYVIRVARRTTPLSEAQISSRLPATAVLEVAAGFAERWGIARGARLLLTEPAVPQAEG